jgi:hypothetical protein
MKVPCGYAINVVIAQRTVQGVFASLEEAKELTYLNVLI